MLRSDSHLLKLLFLKGYKLKMLESFFKKGTKLEKYIFCLIFLLWFSLDFIYSADIGNYSWGTYNVYLHLLSPIKYALIIYIILFCKYDIKEWGIIGIVSAVLFISARNSEMYDLFYILLFPLIF